MMALLRWCGFNRRGVVAVEFAITLPIVLFFLGGITDFGLAYYSQSCLASAVAAAAEYALLADQRGQTLTQTSIQTVLTNAAAQSLPNATVTATATNPALCYCMTGSSPNTTMNTTAVTCGSSCASGGTASKYVQLTLSYNYNAILPLYSTMASTTTLSQSAWVPLQ